MKKISRNNEKSILNYVFNMKTEGSEVEKVIPQLDQTIQKVEDKL